MTAKPQTAPNKAEPETLPREWQRIRLADVVLTVQAGFAAGERDPKGTIQLRMNNVTKSGTWDWSSFIRVPADKDTKRFYALEPGDVLFNNTNSTEMVGKSALFEGHQEPIVFSNHFTRIRSNTERLVPEFLSLWLLSRWQKGDFARLCDRWIGQSAIQRNKLLALELPLPPLAEQRRIAGRLREQLAAVGRAGAAVQAQTETLDALSHAVLRESLSNGNTQPVRFADCLREVTEGIGDDWREYRVLGATRAGLAPAKEGVGKNPGRYKPVRAGTIFYNPMRILLGSIAMLDEEDTPGITSPDYVVMTAVEGRLSARWFYQWFRSRYGAEFIKSMTRGAVRERLMFRRLAPVTLALPDWKLQQTAAGQFAEIKKAKAKLSDQLETLDRLPAALLREALNGNS